jgi:hypothetical protein
VALWLAAAGCVEVAEDRAQRDLQVGRAASNELKVEVEEGLACVRRIDGSQVDLWLGAPDVRIGVTRDTGLPFTLAADNVMPDATVTVNGAIVPVMVEQGPRPTQKRWTLSLFERSSVVRIAPPDATSPTPFRFADLADVQEAIGRVQDIYARIDADPAIRFVLFSGDLTQRGSEGELDRFERELAGLRVPMYPTLGNHELGASWAPYHTRFGRGSYRFRFHDVQFTMLDDASATVAPVAYGWLDGWLRDAAGSVHVVAMHIPPLDPVGLRNGGFASRAEASRLLGMLAAGRVDLTIYGHVHSYYGFENGGAPAVISGGGGAVPERFDGIGRHFLSLDVDPVAQRITWSVVRVD